MSRDVLYRRGGRVGEFKKEKKTDVLRDNAAYITCTLYLRFFYNIFWISLSNPFVNGIYKFKIIFSVYFAMAK